MKKILNLLLFSILFISCNHKEEILDGDKIFDVIDISYLDKNKVDLLDPNNQNSYDKSEIKIYAIDTVIVEKYEIDYKNDDDDLFFIPIPVYYNVNEDSSTTYIDLNKNDTDTIKCVFSVFFPFPVIKEAYYNKIKVADGEKQIVHTITK